MKLFKITALAVVLSSLLITSCSKDEVVVTQEPLGAYVNGFFVLNQGNFGQPNSEVSFVSNDLNTLQNNAFKTVNPSEILGDTGQDIGFYNNLAYIVMNNSNKIEIVNRYTLKHIGAITTGLKNPRYITFTNGNGYVTNWGDPGSPSDDYVAVINLINNTVEDKITVVEGPEKILSLNNKLYVAHKGGYGSGNSVSVINIANKSIAPVTVGDIPNALVENAGNLYVLCEGKASWTGSETAGKLVKINLTNNTTTSLDFGTTQHPSNLVLSNGNLFYTLDADIYKMSVSSASLPTQKAFSTTPQGVYGVYSFAVTNDKIFVGDALNYNSNGKVHVYDLAGNLVKTHTVGIIPAGFYFNN